MGSRYAAAARAAGDLVTELTGVGDHFTLIDPSSQVWADVRSHLKALQADTASNTTPGESAAT